MITKRVLNEIDRTIKEIWTKNIRQDYMQEYMMNEDCLKVCLYYHMRRRLATVLKENNLRIYTEFTFPELKYRADMVIAEYDPDWEETESSLASSIKKEHIVAIMELKFTRGADWRTQDWVRHDTMKLKNYLQNGNIDCQYYFAVIYETPCASLNWMDRRSTDHWANGSVTELDAGQIDGEMLFEVHAYNGMNMDL